MASFDRPGAADDGRVVVDVQPPGAGRQGIGPEPGNIREGRLEHQIGTVAGGSCLEAFDPVRRTVEPDVPRCPGIDGGGGAVAGRIEDDRGRGGGVLHQPTPVQPAAGEATGGDPPATDAEVEGRARLAHQVAAAHEE